MKKLVSILIPAYNAKRWIRETIQSALNQTWPHKEIIVINDGSADNTYDIARQFENSFLKVINQENRGPLATRNRLRDEAQGDYLQWLDHDDALSPEKIALQMEQALCDQNEKILYSCGYGTFYEWPKMARLKPNALWKNLTPIEYFLEKFNNNNTWLQPPVWLVSRYLSDRGGPWVERKSPDDDGEFFSKIIRYCEKITFVPDAYSYYRIGNLGSLCHVKTAQTLENHFLSTKATIQQLLEIENSTRTRLAAVNFLQNRLWNYFPDTNNLFPKLQSYARELGGELVPPTPSMKYSIVKKIIGINGANWLQNNVWRISIAIRKSVEIISRIIYDILKR